MNATEIAAITTEPSGKAVAEFLSVLETKEVDKLLTIWAEDAVFERRRPTLQVILDRRVPAAVPRRQERGGDSTLSPDNVGKNWKVQGI